MERDAIENEVGQSDSLFMFWHGKERATLLKYEYQITSEGDRRRHVPTFPAPTQPVAPRPSPHLGNHYTRSTSGRIRFNQFQFHRPPVRPHGGAGGGGAHQFCWRISPNGFLEFGPWGGRKRPSPDRICAYGFLGISRVPNYVSKLYRLQFL